MGSQDKDSSPAETMVFEDPETELEFDDSEDEAPETDMRIAITDRKNRKTQTYSHCWVNYKKYPARLNQRFHGGRVIARVHDWGHSHGHGYYACTKYGNY